MLLEILSLIVFRVDCTDQNILMQYGLRKSTPACIAGTQYPVTHDAPCYWSLARDQYGLPRPPTRECHLPPSPCYAKLTRVVRSDGVIVTMSTPCEF